MTAPKDQGGFTWHKPAAPRGALLPSATVEWSTPSWLFRQLDAEFCFTVDVAAAVDNAKCKRFYTKGQDGLAQSWAGERVWCNPPYDHRSLAAFASKAEEEIRNGTLTALLVPVKADQAWWHAFAITHEVRFIRGRVAFGNAGTAPMPVCVVIISMDHGPRMVSLRRGQQSILALIGDKDV